MKVTATEFKAKCLGLLDRVNQTDEPILITKRGTVVAQLVPPPPATKKPWLALRGSGKITGDIVSPAFTETEIEGFLRGELAHGKKRKNGGRSAH